MRQLVDLIRKSYSKLTTRETQLANLLIENPDFLVVYQASELAKKANVSNSTVTRLIKNIGLESYDKARKMAREEFGAGSPLSILAKSPRETTSGTDDLLGMFAEQEIGLLQSTFANLSAAEIDEIATHLCNAKNLGFLGLRNSHFFASYARWQFIQFRKKTRQMPGAGETIAERIADLGKGDVVMVVAVRRLVGKIHRYIEAITNTGADVLLLTDSSSAGKIHHARWTIVCPVENPNVFDSYVGVLSVIRLLAYESFIKSGRKGQEYMVAIEHQHDVLSEFD